MAEKPKVPKRKPENPDPDNVESGPEQEKSYYYDDAHGYEDFDPEKDEDEDEDDDYALVVSISTEMLRHLP